MLEVILDTETTGLSTTQKHRIVEIACVELNNQITTGKVFHTYINPQRSVSEDAFKVHGYSDEFLSDKKKFNEIVDDFLNFIDKKKIIIHNAPFDLGFLNYELRLVKKKEIDPSNVVDTLEIARQKFPGSQNSLDALCKRFSVDTSKREKHSALVDCHLLKNVYVNLLDQKEPKFNFNNIEHNDLKFEKRKIGKALGKIIKPSEGELRDHKNFLKKNLSKNFFN